MNFQISFFITFLYILHNNTHVNLSYNSNIIAKDNVYRFFHISIVSLSSKKQFKKIILEEVLSEADK